MPPETTLTATPPDGQGSSAAATFGFAASEAARRFTPRRSRASRPTPGNAGGHSVWYVWTAPCRCTFTFETTGSSFNTLLGVYKGSSVSALSKIASNDDIAAATTASSVRFKAAAGVTYRIAVDGKNGGSGSAALAWRQS